MTIINGVSRIGYMTGGKSALWKDEEMADIFSGQAVKFIEQHREKPFFLYFATHDPHVPRLPHPRFVGKTAMGPRGDALVQMDWSVGEVLKALDRVGLTNDTLIIYSSDNGPVVDDGYKDEAVAKLGSHKPAGPWRGGKYSNFEAGTRVPLIVRWPARIKAGISAALVSQIDLFASLAALVGQPLSTGEAPDSVNVLPALLGESKNGRESLVEQASVLSLREGSWKYIEPGKGMKVNVNTNTEMGNDPDGQLYDLNQDPGETKNLVTADGARAARMRERLRQIRQGRRP
jgi:arylsulfatase A-like enzyme